MKKDNEFWSIKTPYGVIHRASNTSTNNSRCLIVYVHGIFGDCIETWGNMPKWVLSHAEIDIDVVSYSYPTGIFQRCSVPQAADDLITWLETEFQDYHHIFLITHSTGGLVVKQALIKSFRSLKRENADDIIPYSLTRNLFSRTRRVINIAVPHEGGSAFVSLFGDFVYSLIYVLISPFLIFVRFLSQGNKDWGRNKIIRALRWKNRWLKKLEATFLDQQKQALEANLPIPGVFDICAKADLSVPFSTDPDQRKLYFRGTHESIKIPKRINSPIVSIVAERVEQFAIDVSSNIVSYLLVRIAEVNMATGITRLIASSTDVSVQSTADFTSSLTSVSSGSQAEVVEQLIFAINKKTEQPKQMVVTGAAGVGKSIATRMLAWQLGMKYLTVPESGASLPLFIPLQQVNIGTMNGQTYSWEMMWQWWLNWGKSIFKEPHCDLAWLEERFNNKPVTIILDGLDDFLHNHPSIGFSSMVTLLADVQAKYSHNPNFTVIVGIRSSIHGLDRLVRQPKDIYEVLRLSIKQAKETYPHCINWIDSIKDSELLDFILTPLILANYEPDTPTHSHVSNNLVMTQYTLMSQTINTILGRSNIVGKRDQANQAIENVHVTRALTFIAWLFHYKSRGEINIETLHKEALDQKNKWQAYFEQQKQLDEDFYFSALADEKEEILFAFDLIIQPDTCNGILQRTVFVPTGRGRVRFAHRQWQEFLLSQYLALCIQTRHFSELGMAAFHSRIYKMSGDVFGKRIVTDRGISALLEAWENNNKNAYITGNVIAFLSWTHTSIEPKAIQRLIKQVLNIGQLAQILLMGGLPCRILYNHPEDVSLSDIRRALLPQMKIFASNTNKDDPVVSSLSWCYQKAFASQLNIEAPSLEWPRLGIEDEVTEKALPLICSEKNNEYILDERSKSLQHAFLVPVFEAYKDNALLIRAVHYLYYLVVAQKHGVHSVELAQELPHILLEGGEFEQIVKNFDAVPELFQLFRNCQTMHSMF